MKRFSRFFIFISIFFSLINHTQAHSKETSTGPVTVKGRRILVHGKPFFMKGVGYQPVPIDEDVGYPVYDQPEIYLQDLKLMREMGCNTIRTWGPADSTEFLNACWNNGNDPIYVITGPWLDPPDDVQDPAIAEKIRTEWKEFILKHKDHPALLMWQIGNEHNYWYKHNIKAYYQFINEIAKMAYELEGSSWHPFTTANGGIRNPSGPIGDPVFFTDDETMDYIDVWGANIYSGDSFHDLFDHYSLKSRKPLWISEYGCDALDDRSKEEYQKEHSRFVTGLWRELTDYSDIVSGGTIMAWSDEWWKGGNPAVHDKNGWNSGSQPDGVSNEEWYGIVAVQRNAGGTDIRLPRKLYYSLKKEWAEPVEFKDYNDRELKSSGETRQDLHTGNIVPGENVTFDDIQGIAASSSENNSLKPLNAMDGSDATRWASLHGQDPSWLLIELKKTKKLTGIMIHWETASAKKYRIQVSKDGLKWKDAAVIKDGEQGEKREIYFNPVNAVSLRIFCETRTTEWGYSIFEIRLNPGAETFK